ncbi:hypothetical protein A3K63_03310 [Candidatus Micrarchaeota archaeon RBG_16_49_10]|nr:MAG: hypothetical protein A3K63_03310 [Candidatus Micrarchaeota archaeon RBG_16_49_10]
MVLYGLDDSRRPIRYDGGRVAEFCLHGLVWKSYLGLHAAYLALLEPHGKKGPDKIIEFLDSYLMHGDTLVACTFYRTCGTGFNGSLPATIIYSCEGLDGVQTAIYNSANEAVSSTARRVLRSLRTGRNPQIDGLRVHFDLSVMFNCELL